MKTYLSTLLFFLAIFCLATATALGQLAPKPKPDAGAVPPINRPAPPGGPVVPGGPAGAGAVPAAAQLPQGNAMFEAIDADGDGVITQRELRRAVVQLKKLDTDQDGNLTLAEIGGAGGPAMPPIAGGQFGDIAPMVDRIMQSDRNGDGMLTADELPAEVVQQLQGADTNGDRALSREEVNAAMLRMQQMRNQFPGGPGGPQGGPGAFQGGPGGTGAEQRQMIGQMMQFDRDGDGMLSGNEVPQQQRTFFRGGDMNQDGLIDAAEMRLIIERNGDRMRMMRDRDNNRRGRNGDADDEKEKTDDEQRRRR